jgi:predicted protein tyrosine phosphatase
MEEGWAVVHACKEPYHRQALGYLGRGAPKEHPEYLIAQRGDRLILNIVDVDNPAFFNKAMIDTALDFIDEALGRDMKVLVHCNVGESRSPSIALLYLACRAKVLSRESFLEAEEEFRRLYPAYNPRAGIRGHLQQNWHLYCSQQG